MVSKHSNESFWNWSEIVTWTSLVNTQKSEPESPSNMATNVIDFKVGFTKIKSRQQVHQIGILQQINVQHAKTHYHIIYPLQFNAELRQCNSISALTIKPWLGAERLLLVSDLNTNKTTTTITSGLRRLGFYMDHRVTGSCWRDSWA